MKIMEGVIIRGYTEGRQGIITRGGRPADPAYAPAFGVRAGIAGGHQSGGASVPTRNSERHCFSAHRPTFA